MKTKLWHVWLVLLALSWLLVAAGLYIVWQAGAALLKLAEILSQTGGWNG